MKKHTVFLAIAAVALNAGASAFACDNGGSNCGVNAWAFKKALNHYCENGSTYINETGALDLARRSGAGSINVDDYLYAFDKTCDHDKSLEIGTETRAGTLDMSAYKAALNKYCTNGSSYVNHSGAKGMAEKSAAGTLDSGNWISAWASSCNTDTADTVGTESRQGTLNKRVFDRAFDHYCSSGSTYLNDSGAIGVARDAARGMTDVDNFMRAFDSTCDANNATIVGQESRAGQLDDSTFEHALNKYCDNGSTYITADGAIQLARLAAHNAVNLRVFYDTWKSTCNFDTSKLVACAGNPTALLGQAKPQTDALALLDGSDAKSVPSLISGDRTNVSDSLGATRAD